MIVSAQNIVTVILQRPPFVMIDELESCNETGSVTTFQIRANNILVNNGHLTEAGLMENIAQTAAAGVGYAAQQTDRPVLVGYIGAVKNFEIWALPKVGSVIRTEVIVTDHVFDATIIQGSITCDNSVLAICEMKIFIKE